MIFLIQGFDAQTQNPEFWNRKSVNTSSLGFLRFRQGESKACALIYMQVQGHHPYRLATFQAHIADLTSNLDTY